MGCRQWQVVHSACSQPCRQRCSPPGGALEGRIRALFCRLATARELASGERIIAVQSRQLWECPPGSPGAGGRWCRYCPLRTAIFTGRTCQWRCTQFYHKESRAPSSPQTE